MRRIWSIAKADFLERSRRFSFLAMIALSLFGAFWFVPKGDGSMQVMVIEPDVFMQGAHPSWIPLASAWGIGFFLPLLGFFYLSNSLAFDEKTGVKHLVTSSPTSNFSYLLGKFISHILLLYCIVAAVFFGSILMMIVRFPGQYISLYGFISPYLYLVSAITLISAIAILFECSRFLRGSMGTVAYILLFFCIFYIAMDRQAIEAGQSMWIKLIDFTGCRIMFENVLREVFEQSGQRLRVLRFLGSANEVSSQVLVFRGIVWAVKDIQYQLGMFIISLVFVGISVPIYKTTKNMKRLPKLNKKHKELYQTQNIVLTDISTYIPRKISSKSRICGGIIAEMKLMLSGLPLAWWFISASGIIACALLSLETAQVMLPLLLIWLIRVFSEMGCREYLHDTLKCIASLPNGQLRQILFSWISGILIALLAQSPVILRMIFAEQYAGIFVCVSGAVFIPSLALFLGEWTKTHRAFELIFVVITYLSLNDVPQLQFMAVQPETLSIARAFVYLTMGLAMGFLSVVKRIGIIQGIRNRIKA